MSGKILALGFFDGIHLGHAELMKAAYEEAKAKGIKSAALTFDTHPDVFVRKINVPLINSPHDRSILIKEGFGVDEVFFIRFTEATVKMNWKDFLDAIVSDYDAEGFVAGYDFSFGFRGEGTAEKLMEYCHERGLFCKIIPAVYCDGSIISSTAIREMMLEGEMERAVKLLGHPHILTDTVRSGHRLGRTIDSPTINMKFPEGVLVPKYGVYASRVLLPDGKRYVSVTNIGKRPTVAGNETHISIESNILDYSGDLYGQTVRLELYSFVRPEMRFEGIDALKAQINRDKESSRRYFEN
ncbi:MAG: riboflavin biosynthesis protein RibF [Oscillospiraceae bacterium]|nr:riboflavin biosynthesis protein RibF [Oscillospiraceae bacterium]